MNPINITKNINTYYNKVLIYVVIGIVLFSIFITLKSNHPCWTDCFDHIEVLISKIPLPNSLNHTIKYCKKIYRKCVPPEKTSRNVSNLKKKMVASNQKWKCVHCDTLLDYTYEIDHIIPISQGGSNDTDNLQALCPHCHRVKTLHEPGYNQLY